MIRWHVDTLWYCTWWFLCWVTSPCNWDFLQTKHQATLASFFLVVVSSEVWLKSCSSTLPAKLRIPECSTGDLCWPWGSYELLRHCIILLRPECIHLGSPCSSYFNKTDCRTIPSIWSVDQRVSVCCSVLASLPNVCWPQCANLSGDLKGLFHYRNFGALPRWCNRLQERPPNWSFQGEGAEIVLDWESMNITMWRSPNNVSIGLVRFRMILNSRWRFEHFSTHKIQIFIKIGILSILTTALMWFLTPQSYNLVHSR